MTVDFSRVPADLVQTFLDALPQPAWLSRADGRVGPSNQAWQAPAANWFDALHPQDRATLQARWHGRSDDSQGRAPDGSRRDGDPAPAAGLAGAGEADRCWRQETRMATAGGVYR